MYVYIYIYMRTHIHMYTDPCSQSPFIWALLRTTALQCNKKLQGQFKGNFCQIGQYLGAMLRPNTKGWVRRFSKTEVLPNREIQTKPFVCTAMHIHLYHNSPPPFLPQQWFFFPKDKGQGVISGSLNRKQASLENHLRENNRSNNEHDNSRQHAI